MLLVELAKLVFVEAADGIAGRRRGVGVRGGWFLGRGRAKTQSLEAGGQARSRSTSRMGDGLFWGLRLAGVGM